MKVNFAVLGIVSRFVRSNAWQNGVVLSAGVVLVAAAVAAVAVVAAAAVMEAERSGV